MGKVRDQGKATLDDHALQRLATDIPRTISELHRLLAIFRSFGIVAAYQHLEHAETVPEACIKSASRSLDLMAFHGDKWLFEAWLQPQLDRLRLRQGHVRFLLSSSVDSKSKERCVELMKNHRAAFEARLSDEAGIFRTIIIDDARLLLGHYGYEVIEKDGGNAKGWKSPQLFIEDNRQWSLLIPFRALFRVAWDKASILHVPSETGQVGALRREFHPAGRDK